MKSTSSNVSSSPSLNAGRLTHNLARLAAVILLCAFVMGAGISQPRNLLGSSYSYDALKNVLIPQASWHPFPKAAERKPWEELPTALKAEFIKRGEQALGYQWPSIPMSLYLDYFRSGSRDGFSRLFSERRQKVTDLVLAECVEGKGRFLDKIADGTLLICDETSWVQPAHITDLQGVGGLPDKSKPVVDLTSAETANLIAWTVYLLGDQLSAVSPLLPSRLKAEVMERVVTPNLSRDDFWWMWVREEKQALHHVNNWTPWICSNWLVSALLLENRSDERARNIYKIMQTLDRFTNSYPDDGGCDEGPSYWGQAGGSFFECLELLSNATNGKVDVFSKPLVREIGRYIYRAHIHDSYFVNFSDAPARVSIAADLVTRYGLRIHDDTLAGLGAFAASLERRANAAGRGNLTRQLFSLFNNEAGKAIAPREPLLKDVWLPQTQFMVAREHENSFKGLYLAAQGLHNEKSHNHNDVGNFVIYANGEPVIIDVGVEAYTAKTFSKERYSIWTMQSAYHNLPTINGLMQSNGRAYAAKDVRYAAWQDSVKFSLDLSGAYPREAGVNSWKRSLTMDRKNGSVELSENYVITNPVSDLTLSLMTPCKVLSSDRDTIVLRVVKQGSNDTPVDIAIRFDPQRVTPQIEKIPLKDDRLRRIWGDELQRILFKIKSTKQHDGYTITFSKKA
jgi:hypothetical protein